MLLVDDFYYAVILFIIKIVPGDENKPETKLPGAVLADDGTVHIAGVDLCKPNPCRNGGIRNKIKFCNLTQLTKYLFSN